MLRLFFGLTLALTAAAAPALAVSRDEAFCPAFRAFVAADLPEDGRRSVLFLPMGMDAEAVDMYAPMQGSPLDDAADGLYKGVAWMTHYEFYDEFAAELGACLKQRLRFAPVKEKIEPDLYQAEALDRRTRRRITIDASQAACPDPLRQRIGYHRDMCVRVSVIR